MVACEKDVKARQSSLVCLVNAAQSRFKSAHLGLKVVAHNRDMVEQGVSQDLSGLIPLGRVTAVTLCVALKRRWLDLNFGTCVTMPNQVAPSISVFQKSIAMPVCCQTMMSVPHCHIGFLKRHAMNRLAGADRILDNVLQSTLQLLCKYSGDWLTLASMAWSRCVAQCTHLAIQEPAAGRRRLVACTPAGREQTGQHRYPRCQSAVILLGHSLCPWPSSPPPLAPHPCSHHASSSSSCTYH